MATSIKMRLLGGARDTGRLTLLFFGGWALLLPQSLVGINIFDEGFIVTGAMLILDGALPYRDFLSMYGPGQYLLTAAFFAVFGEQLLTVRILHSLILSALALLVLLVARNLSKPGSFSPYVVFLTCLAITLFANPSVGYPAVTAGLLLLWSVHVFVERKPEIENSTLAKCSAAVGLAGVFRWDFGLLGLAALSIAAMLDRTAIGTLSRSWPGMIVALAGPALGILFVVYFPLLVVFSDFENWYREVFSYLLTEFPKWRDVEMLRPSYLELMAALTSGGGLEKVYRSALMFLYPIVPAVLAVAAIGIVAGNLRQKSPKQEEFPNGTRPIYLALIVMFLLNQMRVRPDLWHGFPAFVSSLPLLPFVVDALKVRVMRNQSVYRVTKAAGFVAAAIVFGVALQGLLAAKDKRLVPLETPRSTHISVTPAMVSYGELVNFIRGNTAADEPIYSGVLDHSRLFVNDVMLYFLTNRRAAERFVELEPGIANTASGQAEIIDSLERKGVRVIVLADITANERNQVGASNGIRNLDRYLRDEFAYVKSFGRYVVLVRRQGEEGNISR
jgi:hypothetical protein